ncbi:Geraniol 8-hydroxylase protein [Dioscorea alata]|uniref:Geraniol 8-hydroxylase protein n=1 Tax=Dioscorea alata TaxID=55571 RepID=A0ACB7WG60_DIOAL|nr:Geraniol 8-hydroxylase protein [Dioscorea alata]
MEAISWAPLVLALVSILIIRTIATGRRLHKGRTLPPGPRPLPIIGNLHQVFDGIPHRCLARLAEKYGPIMTLRFGQTTTVVISSPDMAREVLQKHDQAFSYRAIPDAIRAVRHSDVSVAWLPPNPEWRNLRMIYNTELFSTKRLESTKVVREQKVRQLISYVSEFTILNVLSRAMFSVDLLDLRSESSVEVLQSVQTIMRGISEPNLADFFPWLKVLDPLGVRRRVTKSMKKLHDIFDEHVDRRLRGEDATPHDDLLDRLTHGDKMECMHDRFIRNVFFTDLIMAGTETSANTVEWTMAELLRNPVMMAKVKEEIDSVIEPGKEVEESDIEKLHYLQAVMKESFRLHPTAAFLLPRRAERTVDVGDHYVVPEGTHVVINNWVISRDKRLWEDPEVFFPERFLKKDIDIRGREFKLMPFGSGRRICPGLQLAVRLVPLIIASLLRGFDWQPPDGMGPEDIDMREIPGIPVAMAVPLRAVPLAA